MGKKTFKAVSWVRQVREQQQREDVGLSDDEKIARTAAEARRFRASRAGKRKGKRAPK
ncbi:MAG TPA: hypothetical protein VNA25_13395 [Phycisphaerae bacterium]|nr:hypothetical protein [Phycisphaerae bacterium]